MTASAARTPLSLIVKVPLVLALVAAAIGLTTTITVHGLVQASQEREVHAVASTYLDGLAPALVDPTLRKDIWEVFETLDSRGPFSGAIRPVETVVADTAGNVIASSSPATTKTGVRLPERFSRANRGTGSVVQEERGRAYASQLLFADGRRIGAVHAEFDITTMLAERTALLRTLIGWSAFLTLLLGFGGWLVVRRMIAPVDILARHMDMVEGEVARPVPEAEFAGLSGEFRRLFGSYNRMAAALRERQALLGRVAAEERLASLGRLAAGVAHEINNPLGGLFTTLHLLRNSGSATAHRKAVDLLERGLGGIRDIVRAMLETQRPDRNMRPLQPQDFEDLRILVASEIRERTLSLSWTIGGIGEVSLPAAPIRQIVLNLVLNAIRAAPDHGRVSLDARIEPAGLRIEVADSGAGMDPEEAAFIEGRTSSLVRPGDGLGLWLVRQIAGELRANISVGRSELGGTAVVVRVPSPAGGALTHAA